MGRVYKVYVMSCPDGVHSKMVAAKTKKEAAELLHSTRPYFKDYATETYNEADRFLALEKPGQVYIRQITGDREWRRV